MTAAVALASLIVVGAVGWALGVASAETELEATYDRGFEDGRRAERRKVER